MTDAAALLQTLENICGVHVPVAVNQTVDPAGPLIGNLLVAGAASVVTLACIVAAVALLINPGERAPDHPKYRVLSADR